MAVQLRQTMTVTLTIDVDAVADWDAVKYPGWSSHDPETGQPEGEPPMTFREDLEYELHRFLQGRLSTTEGPLRDLYVCAVSARPDGEPYECGRVLDPNTEEPF